MAVKICQKNMAVKGKVGELNEEELLQLVDRTWNKEATVRFNVKFDSEKYRADYLRQSKFCHDTVHRDLKHLMELVNSSEEVHLFRTTNKIYNYTLFSYDFSYQYVVEPILRAEYIKRISLHSKQMEQEAVAASGDREKMKKISHDAAWYRNTMMHYIDTEQQPQGKSFIASMLRSKLKVVDIVKRYVGKLKFRGPFNKLTTVQKLQVWNEVIKESGKSTFEITRDLNSLSESGLMVLLITGSMIVYRILMADHKPARIFNKDGTENINGVDGFAVDAMDIVCWWGNLPDRYKPLPAEVVYGEKVVGGVTAGQAIAYAVGITFLFSGVVALGTTRFSPIIIGGRTATTVEEAESIPLRNLAAIGEEEGAALAETSFIEGSGLLAGEVAGEVAAEEVAVVAGAALGIGAAPIVIGVAAVILVGFILFKIWRN